MEQLPISCGRRYGLSLCCLLGLFAASQRPAFAEKKKEKTLEEVDKLPAVQNRLYRNEHEFNLGVGVLPVDPYAKGINFHAGYAWHINDTWAVDAHFNYLINLPTSLRDKLEGNFGIPTSRFAEVQWYVDAGTMFKPIYGKLSFLNKALVYGEFYFTLAAIVAQMDGGAKTEEFPQGKEKRLAFGAAPGFGIRGFVHPRMSLRLDFRWMLLYSAGEGHFPLALTLTFAFTTRSDL